MIYCRCEATDAQPCIDLADKLNDYSKDDFKDAVESQTETEEALPVGGTGFIKTKSI